MAKMKRGSQTGKLDAHFEGIRVGDRLRNPDGEVARVDEYGSLVIVGGEKIAPRDWDGGAWYLTLRAEDDDTPDPMIEVENVPPIEVAETPEVIEAPVTDEDLIIELRRRGYSGTLSHTYSVTEEVRI